MDVPDSDHGPSSPPLTEAPFDVIVCGAGLAGSSLAVRLARAGLRVAILDAARFPRDKTCGEFLSPECWGPFDRLGLSPRLGELGFEPIRLARISTAGGRLVEARLTDRDGRPGIGLSRSSLDALLLNTAAAYGATAFEGFRVTQVVREEGRVVGVVARRGAERALHLRAKVAVGAEGRRSPFVQQTGRITARGFRRTRYFGLKRHLAVKEPTVVDPPETVGLHLIPGGYVGTCGIEGGRVNLCGILPETLLSRHRGDLDALADEAFRGNPRLERLWEGCAFDGAWKTVANVCVEYARPSVPGVFYVGDSQGTIDPLGGQGMTMALLGAETLAPFVERAVLDGHAGPALQAEYFRAWERRFGRRIHLCRLFHQVLVNPLLHESLSRWAALGAHLLTTGYSWTREPLAVAG